MNKLRASIHILYLGRSNLILITNTPSESLLKENSPKCSLFIGRIVFHSIFHAVDDNFVSRTEARHRTQARSMSQSAPVHDGFASCGLATPAAQNGGHQVWQLTLSERAFQTGARSRNEIAAVSRCILIAWLFVCLYLIASCKLIVCLRLYVDGDSDCRKRCVIASHAFVHGCCKSGDRCVCRLSPFSR